MLSNIRQRNHLQSKQKTTKMYPTPKPLTVLQIDQTYYSKKWTKNPSINQVRPISVLLMIQKSVKNGTKIVWKN